ncbi:MAG TPA: GNAT family N-acetyltransferase [Terriglobales bacterium]|nr:GNAT family N-acetyltransferase [Terriglobales bacterium]
MSTFVSNGPASKSKAVTIRSFTTPDEMKACVDLQKVIWGFSDVDVVPHRMFVVAHRTGGQVIGAFDGERLIGFALSFIAQRDGKTYIHSHMAAVLPEYQNRGIGRKLKLAQRDEALERGFDLIEWTFDPLQIRNAHFNIVRLGAVAREYLPNVYGRTTSPLHHGLPTDRLVAHWRIRERNETRPAGESNTGTREVCVPKNIFEISARDPTRAQEIQSEIRNQFQQLFKDGWAVTDFEADDQNGKYLLRRI